MSKTYKNQFKDIAFEILKEETEALPVSIIREKVSNTKGKHRYVKNISSRQAGALLKADKRFIQAKSPSLPFDLWQVKE